MTDKLKTLAASVAAIGEHTQYNEGRQTVLICAVLALVRAHPQPELFAAEFWRLWQLLGSQNSNDALGEPALSGIDELLSMLEESCSAPMDVRPGKPSV